MLSLIPELQSWMKRGDDECQSSIFTLNNRDFKLDGFQTTEKVAKSQMKKLLDLLFEVVSLCCSLQSHQQCQDCLHIIYYKGRGKEQNPR